MRDLTIIIPVLDDAPALRRLLGDLRRSMGAAEVIVVDGGSRDDSIQVAQEVGATTIVSSCGRGRQLRAGLRASERPWVWMLHADSRIDSDAVAALGAVVAAGAPAWGRFDVRLSGNHPLLRVVETMMNVRSRVTGICTGDQGIFAHRQLLEAAGGMPEQELMEDIELSRRLKRLARPCCLHVRIETSSRRWETRGVLRTIGLMWCMRLAYFVGVPSDRLARLYHGR